MSVEDVQSSNLHQHFWDHIFQKSFPGSRVWFWESSCSKWRLFVFFCISSINFGNEVINVRYTTLDSANVLKIIIFSSSVIFLILHKFKTFCIIVMFFTKCFCICNFWVQEKCTPKIFIIYVIKSIHVIPQTAILTPFREPMPAISHFNTLGSKPQHFENNLKFFISPLTDFWSF